MQYTLALVLIIKIRRGAFIRKNFIFLHIDLHTKIGQNKIL